MHLNKVYQTHIADYIIRVCIKNNNILENTGITGNNYKSKKP